MLNKEVKSNGEKETLREIPPVSRPKSTARTAYNQMSRWYDWISGSSEAKYREAGLSILKPAPGEKILEIGCATGHSVVDLARAVGDTGFVTGLDLSEKMAAVSRDRLEENQLSARSLVIQGDGADLPFPACQFDAVFLSFTLELFDTPELPRVLAESLRILKSDGRIALVTMDSRNAHSWMIKAYLKLRTRFPRFLDCRPIPVETLLKEASFLLLSKETYSMYGFPVAVVLAQVQSRDHDSVPS